MWFRRHRTRSRTVNGKEMAKAKAQLETSRVLREYAHTLADEHRAIQQNNHFADTVSRTLRARK